MVDRYSNPWDDLRETIARAVLDSVRCMGALTPTSAETYENKIADFIIEALSAAGFRILAPGALDAETLERAAKIAELNDAFPSEGGHIAAAIRALKGE